METWDAIRVRRNVRQYSDRAISPDDLDRILEAGRRAPSSMNAQRWDFVVVTDREQLQELAKVWRYGRHVARSAATMALVVPETDDPDTACSIEYDLGQVTMSMMLAAADLGIGSGHSAVGDQDAARLILQVPEDHNVEWMVALGYPPDRQLTPIENIDRRPFDDVVHREHW